MKAAVEERTVVVDKNYVYGVGVKGELEVGEGLKALWAEAYYISEGDNYIIFVHVRDGNDFEVINVYASDQNPWDKRYRYSLVGEVDPSEYDTLFEEKEDEFIMTLDFY